MQLLFVPPCFVILLVVLSRERSYAAAATSRRRTCCAPSDDEGDRSVDGTAVLLPSNPPPAKFLVKSLGLLNLPQSHYFLFREKQTRNPPVYTD